jgi:hypothetical protein
LSLLALTALSWFFFFVVVNRNRLQILSLKHLVAIQATDVFNSVPAIEELGSLVLATLHSEITPILDRPQDLSSADTLFVRRSCDSVQFYVEMGLIFISPVGKRVEYSQTKLK